MLTPRRLIRSVLGTAAAAVYTAPAGARARIDAFALVNTSAAPVSFSVWLVPSGLAADSTTQLVKDRSVAAGGSTRVLEGIGQWVEGGGGVFMSASSAGAITVNASGVEQTNA